MEYINLNNPTDALVWVCKRLTLARDGVVTKEFIQHPLAENWLRKLTRTQCLMTINGAQHIFWAFSRQTADKDGNLQELLVSRDAINYFLKLDYNK